MIIRPKKYIPKLHHFKTAEGNERRKNLTKEILKDGTPTPKTLQYKDIDNSFKGFVDSTLDIAYDGKKLPTIVLLSSQRFSEYAQSWRYVDNDQNILMNFKTITRDNNPKPGDNQGGLWNIPGNRLYTIAKIPVLDKNGTESLLLYKMRQPYCVDMLYDISIFTNKYELLNLFNSKVIDQFKARQCYIRPNGHFIPMVLEDISDESEYNIDDRKYFSQTFHIKVMAYIINEDDFAVEQVPTRFFVNFMDKKNKGEVSIDEQDGLFNKEINLNMSFPPYEEEIKFIMDGDIDVIKVKPDNVRHFRLHINDEPIYTGGFFKIKNGDYLRIKISKYDISNVSTLTFNGVDKNIVLTEYDINPESMLDAKTSQEDIMVD